MKRPGHVPVSLELRHLRYFIALSETLHFGKAAEQLQLSQPTLSHQVKQLEDMLGTPLFTREKRRVALTDAGQRFLPRALAALGELDHALMELKEPLRSTTGEIRIAAATSIAASLLPDCLAEFASANPSIRIAIDEIRASRALEDLLIDEAVDIGLGYPPFTSNELSVDVLYEEQTKLLVRRAHPFAERKKVRLIDLHHQRLALIRHNPFREQLLDYFKTVDVEPEIVFDLANVQILPQLVARMDVAAIVPQSVPFDDTCLTAIPIERPVPTRTANLLVKKNRTYPPVTLALIAIIRRMASEKHRHG